MKKRPKPCPKPFEAIFSGIHNVKKKVNQPIQRQNVKCSFGHLIYLCCSGKKAEGLKDHRRGRKPPVKEHQQNKSPEGATEYLTCLISTCIYLCRPLGASFVVALLSGACTPVCCLSSLRDLRLIPMSCFSSGKSNKRSKSRGAPSNLPLMREVFCREAPLLLGGGDGGGGWGVDEKRRSFYFTR